MNKIEKTGSDRVFDTVNLVLCSILFVLVAYPLIYVVSASFSDPFAVLQGQMKLIPVGFTLNSYAKILEHQDILIGYKNSIILVVLGTGINFILTFFGAYTLSKKDLYGRTVITMFFAFTMFFNGGMIPRYLVVKGCGLLDTVWSMIIPGAISMYNLVVMRTFFQNSIPDSLIEAAEIDGASNWQIMFRVVLPLSKSIIAVICLFYGVAHWNQYFQALLYLSTREKFPLQIFLREILLLSQVQDLVDTQGFTEQVMQGEGIKYSLIIVASVPVLMVYPFIQKHFVKGVMLGAIKG
ncbi:MAG: carbohydrate ABC transporter permease [Acutalibacter sp.]|nr:carbohydrate ABC transporter permease [Acutalibacter sp.]